MKLCHTALGTVSLVADSMHPAAGQVIGKGKLILYRLLEPGKKTDRHEGRIQC